MKLRTRLTAIWAAIRGDFDDQIDCWEPLHSEFYVGDNSLLDEIPFVEIDPDAPFIFRTSLPPTAWRKVDQREPYNDEPTDPEPPRAA